MSRFRKKPVEIEARQLDKTNAAELVHWINHSGGEANIRGGPGGGSRGGTLLISTLEGTHRASLGDWIIQGVQGEFYPCKPDIFEETYEAVDG